MHIQAASAFDNHVTLTFDLPTSGSSHCHALYVSQMSLITLYPRLRYRRYG